VSHAAGQLPNRFHLLRLLILRFERPAFGDVKKIPTSRTGSRVPDVDAAGRSGIAPCRRARSIGSVSRSRCRAPSPSDRVEHVLPIVGVVHAP
jgi:hypothetical protein